MAKKLHCIPHPHLSGRSTHRPLRINLPFSTKRPQFSCIGTAYKQLDKPKFIEQTEGVAKAKAPSARELSRSD